MPNLIAETILDDDLMKKHKTITFNFSGERSDLRVSASMPTVEVLYSDLLANTVLGCTIARKIRKFSTVDQIVIKAETKRFLHKD